MERPIRLAAIGLGRWAGMLARAYTRSPEVKLVTCFSRQADDRHSFATAFGCEEDADYGAVLGRSDVDAVVVTASNDQHADLVVEAARAGKHVFVEKPIATTIADALRMREAVEAAGVKFLCGHSARKMGGLRRAKELLGAGALGSVSMVEAVTANERGLQLKSDVWRADPRLAPGGVLTQLGIHQIDNLQYLFGPVKSVFSFNRASRKGIDNAMISLTLLEFEAGPLGYLGSNWVSPGMFGLTLYGTEGVLSYSVDNAWWNESAELDAHSTLTLRSPKQMEAEKSGAGSWNRMMGDTAVEFHQADHLKDNFVDWVRAIADGAALDAGVDDAIRNLAVVLAAVESSATRRPVDLSEVLGR